MSRRAILEGLLAAGKLHELESLLFGKDTARTMRVSSDLLAVITPPFPDTPEGERHGELRAWLEGFLLGGDVSVAENPDQKDPDAMLARVHPVNSEFWSIRVTTPEETPGIRSLGAFTDKDEFLALTWEFREDMEEFDSHVEEVIEVWNDFFDPFSPHRGASIDEYLSHPWTAV
jgi:hypothetical protein